MKATGIAAILIGLPAATIGALLATLVLLVPNNSVEWANPAEGLLSDGFGWRTSPITDEPEFHTGQDIATACGRPILAAHSGTVSFAGPDSGFGNLVVIDHGGDVSTAYGHMYSDGVFVEVGEHVRVGEEIAVVGDAGLSTGCHLHFEVRLSGVPVDPLAFAKRVGISLGD